MQITIEIPDFFEGSAEDGIRGASLQDMVVDAAVQRLVTDGRREEWARTLRERVTAIRDETIREAVRPAIEEALTRVIQPTDAYGNPKGEPVTLHERITRDAMAWLTKAESRQYGDKAVTPVERLIKEEVNAAFKRELGPVMEEAKREVIAAIKEQGAAVLAETIARMGRI